MNRQETLDNLSIYNTDLTKDLNKYLGLKGIKYQLVTSSIPGVTYLNIHLLKNELVKYELPKSYTCRENVQYDESIRNTNIFTFDESSSFIALSELISIVNFRNIIICKECSNELKKIYLKSRPTLFNSLSVCALNALKNFKRFSPQDINCLIKLSISIKRICLLESVSRGVFQDAIEKSYSRLNTNEIDINKETMFLVNEIRCIEINSIDKKLLIRIYSSIFKLFNIYCIHNNISKLEKFYRILTNYKHDSFSFKY